MKEYKILVNGNEYKVAINDIDEGKAKVSVNGIDYEAEIASGLTAKPKTPKVVQKPTVPSTDAGHPAVKVTRAPSASMSIKSPLPGVILDVLVKEGDKVSVGQKLLILEAMKMENNIESDKDGIIKRIVSRKGDSVLEGDVLIEIE